MQPDFAFLRDINRPPIPGPGTVTLSLTAAAAMLLRRSRCGPAFEGESMPFRRTGEIRR